MGLDVIVISSHDEEAHQKRAISLGAKVFLSKSELTPSKLETIISKL